MCKLFMATGPLTRRTVLRAVAASNREFRKTEKDGFGFMAADGSKLVARGRYLEPNTYAGYMAGLPQFLSGASAEENSLPLRTTTLLCHGRTSTNSKGLDNVHPFAYRGRYLIHNGIVSWNGPRTDEPPQACDSDQLLHWLVDNKENWDQAKEAWGGFGAIGFYHHGTLTVARDTASLHIARRIKDRGWVMATDGEQLLRICKYAGIALDTPPLAFPTWIVQFRDGKIVSERKWAGFGARSWTNLDTISCGVGYQPANGCEWLKEGNKWTRVNRTKESFPDYSGKGK